MNHENIRESVKGTIYGYGRISRHTQKNDRQVLRLEEICDEIVIETISADSETRPKFDALTAKLTQDDMLICLDLDRAFRSLTQAILALIDMQSRGIQFLILNENLDLEDDLGRLMYILKAYFAEQELKTLRRRTREGIAAAKAKGVKLGRPYALTNAQIRRAYRQVTHYNQPLYKVAKAFGVAHSTLSLSFERLELAST